jgi:hypothetical protein
MFKNIRISSDVLYGEKYEVYIFAIWETINNSAMFLEEYSPIFAEIILDCGVGRNWVNSATTLFSTLCTF